MNMIPQLVSRIKQNLEFNTALEGKYTEQAQSYPNLLQELEKKGNDITPEDYVRLKSMSMTVNLLQQDVVKLSSKIAELYILYKLVKKEGDEHFTEEESEILNNITKSDTFIHVLDGGEITYKDVNFANVIEQKIKDDKFDKEKIVEFIKKMNSFGNI